MGQLSCSRKPSALWGNLLWMGVGAAGKPRQPMSTQGHSQQVRTSTHGSFQRAVIKCVETRFRLLSANPAHDPYTALAEGIHIVDKALWTRRRV